MELIDLAEYSPEDVALVAGGEPDPYGTDRLGIVWREKTEHVGLVDHGRLIAHAGWVPTTVRTTGGRGVDVLGLGSVMVHADYRGTGIGARLVAGTTERMRSAGGRLSLLFCRTERLAFYRRLGWIPRADEVTVDQPGGAIVMPLRTCWTPLVEGEILPEGDLRLGGLPF